MKDAEYIYSLYVQANPVPDPDLLPLTRDEAALLPFIRSTDMITEEERVDLPSNQSPLRRRRAVPALGLAAVLIGAIAAVAILFSGDATPVAAADADLDVMCDPTGCSYEGPTLIEAGQVEISMVNSGTEILALHGWLMEGDALDLELERTPVGTDRDVTGESSPAGVLWFSTMVDPGATHARALTLGEGTYLIDCKKEGSSERVWRVAEVEVVAP